MITPDRKLDFIFQHHRWSLHVLYWFAIIGVYFLFFGHQNSNQLQTAFFVGLLMPVTIGASYFCNYWLVPRYLLQGHYLRFIIYFVYAFIAAVFLEFIAAMLTLLFMAETNIRNMSPATVDLFFLISSTLMVIFCSVAIKLLLYYRQSSENFQRLQKEKAEAELQFLKTQLNPHFLFNTLNNLYYLANEKSEKAPEAILHLSEILDYAMHSSKVQLVAFPDEWRQVQNYIALESLRYDGRVSVSAVLHGDTEGMYIPPMVIMTLVENAFKHGVMHSSAKSWIDIVVNLDGNATRVSVWNSKLTKNTGHGIGLQNLRNQLELLYKDRHHLSVSDEHPDEFGIEMILTR